MGRINSGVGLISGINTAQLIEQLLSIEARPKKLVESQKTLLSSQQTALQGVNAKLLALKLSASGFVSQRVFRATSATSSDDAVLTATSNQAAVPGTYDFVVSRLVTTQQVITSGFVDRGNTPIAPSGGTLTFEFGDARLGADTSLSQLNGGEGVARGKVRITDRSGASQVVDLSKTLTVEEVLEAINDASGINVTARVKGDRLEIVDNTGSTTTNLTIVDAGSTGTVESLGLNTAAVGNTLTGGQVNHLSEGTLLSQLNDGNGVRTKTSTADLTVTRRDGTTFDVALGGAVTVGEVIDRINSASGGNVTAAISTDGARLQLTDSTTGASTFGVAAKGDSKAAVDLGILTSDGDGDGTIVGGRVLASLNSRLIKNLKGGSGVGLGEISITNRSGAATTVDLSGAQSVDDIVGLINGAGAGVTASVNSLGNGLLLTDTTGSTTSNLIVADVTGTAAADLGLAGSFTKSSVDSGNLQLRYISESTLLSTLNGGLGVASGQFRITDSTGKRATVDLSQGETTIQDVLSEINSRGLKVHARINDRGDGILIEDTAASPGTALKVEEAGSTTARDLGILGEAEEAGDDLDGGFEKTITIASLETITGATTLSALNGGDGVSNVTGKADFQIKTRNGSTFDVDLDGATTIADVLSRVSTASGGVVTAAINTNGTSLKLTDTTTGVGTFAITALNSSEAAADLGILSSDTNGDGVIAGNAVVEVVTLDDLVEKINTAGIGAIATVVNDGTPGKPFRLSLTARRPGEAGAFTFDDGGLGFGATTLSEGTDAVVFFGSSDPARAVAITSSRNTLTTAVPGTTIDLKGVSDEAVRVTIARDDSSIIKAVEDFVSRFNDVAGTIDDLDSYVAETDQRGLLLGDPTLARVRRSLFSIVSAKNNDLSGQFTTLTQIGVTVVNSSLSLDRAKLQQALDQDHDAVEQLFTLKKLEKDPETGEVVTTARGIGVRIDEQLKLLTDSRNGAMTSRLNAINRQIELSDRRISQLNEQLERRRKRLEDQFNTMEKVLGQLQNQSSALAGFQPLTFGG